ncbi:ComF family protein [Sandaracinobacter sp. RS1-74]|uniref:ComF family protein n=1 Tax=Sandaracinobacteroides sayramensis TaxID=2913411 RepID=UPI001EDC0F4F|nr:ComF family protein [Sandaracinobacteroides sayramensis]MCG2841802.1 ComF family protein [Sandaracinobacteroides sayramensis]
MATAGRIVEGARAGMRGFADLLMPPGCMTCGEPVSTPHSFCGDCWGALPAVSGARCRQCGVPLPVAWQAESHCLGCLKDPPPFARATAPFLYDGPARQMVLRLKHGRESWAGPMAAAMHRVAPGWVEPGRLLVPVPLHRWRLATRGYNQALLLARALARLGGAEVAPDWLLRVKHTPSTRGLTRAQRLRNVSGAFRVREGAGGQLKGRRVVLVDDVLTTGATASACAKALLRAGAEAVDLLTYARVAATDATPYLERIASEEATNQHVIAQD